MLVYLNGQLVPEGRARISVYDSGLNFADGVFEGMRVYDGRVYGFDEHVDRLFESARALSISIGLTKTEMRDEILRWLRATGIRNDFHFRPIVTRGIRLPPRIDPRFVVGPPTILIVGGSVAHAPKAGIRAVISRVRRVPPDCLDPKIKSLNYGNNILARLDALRQGADDALMLDMSGFLAEATVGNAFLLKHGRLLTPWPKACLAGITRAAVIRIAEGQQLEVLERDLSPTDILNADEIFITGTAAEVTPVLKIEGRAVGTGRVGPVTRKIARLYQEIVRVEGTPL